MTTQIRYDISKDSWTKWQSSVMSKETLDAICGIFPEPEDRLWKFEFALDIADGCPMDVASIGIAWQP